jgi:hypothetical protein
MNYIFLVKRALKIDSPATIEINKLLLVSQNESHFVEQAQREEGVKDNLTIVLSPQ